MAPTLVTACTALDIQMPEATALRAVQSRAGEIGAAALSPEGAVPGSGRPVAAAAPMLPHADITALVLAGGRGSRMGGVDKGLQNFNGTPLTLHTLLRLQMQAGGAPGQVMVNANRNLSVYESFGASVWPDVLEGYAGPLAGFLTGLERCETPYLLTLPCDTPLFPLDLVDRMAIALAGQTAQIAMACAPELDADGHSRLRTQPVFCLLHADLLESLADFTRAGGRKIDAWTALHPVVTVAFDLPGDDPKAFFNANTLAELQSLEKA